MKPLSSVALKQIAVVHGITYEAINPKLRRKIKTRVSRIFPVSQAKLFALLADPVAHQRLFSQFKVIQPVDAVKFAPLVSKNEIISLELVDEGGLKLALAKTTLFPPSKIVKEVISGPFSELGGVQVMDKKKGVIIWEALPVDSRNCTLTAESDFDVVAKSVFVRSLVDTIWVDSFERIMVELGEISMPQKLIKGE